MNNGTLPLSRPCRHIEAVGVALYAGDRSTSFPILFYSGGGGGANRYPLNRRLGGHQSRPGRSGEQKSLKAVSSLTL